MSPSRPRLRAASWIAALCLVLGTGAVMLCFLRAFPPEPARQSFVLTADFDPAAMRQAAVPERLSSEMKEIAALGSRALGQPGARAMQEHMRAAYEAAGLEVHVQDNRCVAPITARREILAANGKPVPGVDVYPLMPNHLQPIVTPEEGLTGILTLATSDTLRSMRRFDDRIAVIDTRPRKPAFGLNWLDYAQRGFKAVIVTHPEALSKLPWRDTVLMLSNLPVNYVRLAANETILDHLGESVTLHVRVDYRDVAYQNVYGVLRGRESMGRALLIGSEYDACSILPDLAPGDMQAVGPAAQLCFLRGLLPYRDSLRRDVIFAAFGGQAMAHDGVKSLLTVLGPNVEGESENPLLRIFDSGAKNEQEEKEQKLRLKQNARIQPLKQDEKENEARLALVQKGLALFQNPAFMKDAGESDRLLKRELDKGARAFFAEQFRYVLNTLVLKTSEDKLQAYLEFLRGNAEDTKGKPFQAYMAKKKIYDQALSAAGNRLG